MHKQNICYDTYLKEEKKYKFQINGTVTEKKSHLYIQTCKDEI